MRRMILVAVSLAITATGAHASAGELRDHLQAHGRPPADYVLAALERHPVVILGEGHWIRHDVELVRDLVPALAEAGVTLALETLQADDQSLLDRVIAAEAWDPVAAMAPMRSAAWPYQEYFEIIHAAWKANRKNEPGVRILAAGPPAGWRAEGIDYDAFMAARVAEVVESGGRVLFYAGLHHAFTRYHQPELTLSGRARAFMDRSGNMLRRRFGERVFLITLHRPFWCGKSEPWGYCLPLDGRIDCAAAPLDRPVGFDVLGSPIADSALGTDSYYSRGHPALRLIDFTDGWIWFRPIERYQLVSLIPLDQFAPQDHDLADVIANNPFVDHELTIEDLRHLWNQERASLSNPLTRRRWEALANWQAACPSL